MLEKFEGGNKQWTIQRQSQHWVHKTQDEDKQNNTTYKRKRGEQRRQPQ